MTTEADERAARALGRLLQREADVDVGAPGGAPPWQRLGERRLLQGVRSAPPRGSLPRTQWTGAAIGVGALLAALALWSQQPAGAPNLDFVVRGEQHRSGSPGAATRVEGGEHEATSIDFSDGSKLEVHARSSARLQEVRSHGATVVVERGGLDAEVAPVPGAIWSVLAGPYEVRVLGTRFTTFWDPREQSFSVRLQRGSVRIFGADIQEAVELRPGQRFDARVGSRWSVTALAPGARGEDDGSLAAPEHPTPGAPPSDAIGPDLAGPDLAGPDLSGPSEVTGPDVTGPSERTTSVTTSPPNSVESRPRASEPRRTWTELVSSGQSERVLGLAEERGVNVCLESCSTEELRALADAARYTGRGALARDALLALRTRGPSEAARAGYFLGSLGESRGQAAGALEWYGRCLQEAPDGPFSAEARAGKMRALLALGRKAEARQQAREYLRLHPNGVAVERARQLLSGP